MTKPNYTHLTLVVDRSGSMANIQSDAQGGINTLIKDQSKLTGEITVSLYEFDTYYDHVFGPIPVSEAPYYNLVPRGGTALLDATGRAINETGAWLRNKAEEDRPSKVLFIIVTDGEENSSIEFTKPQIKAMIETQTGQWQWEFMYLGASVDTFSDASSIGIRTSTRYAATAQGTRNLYAGASYAVASSHLGTATMDSAMPSNIDDDTVVPDIADLQDTEGTSS